MDSQNLYDELKEMNQHLGATAAEFSQLHESLIELMEKNAELEIENQHLRDRINQITEKVGHNSPELSESRKNLEKLYNEGFHVCSSYYGKRRENGEDCIFCTEIIYGRRD
ncbi:DNA replication initiation control protein YabA [Lentilactobacillus raoultii]|uniref:Replication initiation control protein YabA n=1 Tax=Lentilactobacillus raoultii TaxID=1987503 RepID=A0ABW3PIH0_9LACO|nr:DNA replication initiation control protein YabA [Lentilactobacillus raoultii]